ncbi:GIY-YIG nuclease family protein [bacterium]|nr:GIY-YIG nuclease family protein [bacterium]
MKFYIYIIQSSSTGRFYIGSTNNLDDRLNRHNNNRSKATKNRGPRKLVHSEKYDTRSEAVKREVELKSMHSHSYIETLIKRD